MKKVVFHYGQNPTPFEVYSDRDVEVYIDQIERTPVPRGKIRIVILEEPRQGLLYRIVKNHPNYYSYLLTFQRELLKGNPKAAKFLLMKPWVVNYRSKRKHFSVSTVVGGKHDAKMPGYAVRHQLWHNRERIEIPRRFYLSGNEKYWHTFVPWTEVNYQGELVLGTSKEPLFDSMFHIAIENCSIQNYFSEKLLDCFQSRTFPIYYGCQNISDYFDPEGMIRVGSVEEIVEVCNQLTPDVYRRARRAMEYNYLLSKKWLDPKQQVEQAVKEVLNRI
jgi:hypothetical protein